MPLTFSHVASVGTPAFEFGPTVSFGTSTPVADTTLQIATIFSARGGGTAGDTSDLPGWTLVGRAHHRQDHMDWVSGGPPDWITIEVWWRWGVDRQVTGTTTAPRWTGDLVHVEGALAPPICSGFAATANDPPGVSDLPVNPLTVTSTAVGGVFWRSWYGDVISDVGTSGTLPEVGPGVVSHTFDEENVSRQPFLFVIREEPDPTTGGWMLGRVGWGPA